ncbi:MAG: hypothetical protein A2068_01170 [Ignavibacteria bacterium GWB2_35_6b]|nr:MAG: hypothetical protein A2068_01170 [Ignavibacteria bacterium GWB2_35_6b]
MLWKNKFSERGFRNEFLIVISILIISLISLSNFLLFNELREGEVVADPVLNLFSPVNVTWLTFLIIYAGLIIAVIYLIKFPEQLSLAFLTYSITALMRLIAMYTLPLNPPVNIIPLNDPFVQLFGTGNILLKDLFFSGHTSTLFILYLIIENKKLKTFFLLLTISVAVCVLIQHVHYTVDVLAAPFFTYGSFILAKKLLISIRKIL